MNITTFTVTPQKKNAQELMDIICREYDYTYDKLALYVLVVEDEIDNSKAIKIYKETKEDLPKEVSIGNLDVVEYNGRYFVAARVAESELSDLTERIIEETDTYIEEDTFDPHVVIFDTDDESEAQNVVESIFDLAMSATFKLGSFKSKFVDE